MQVLFRSIVNDGNTRSGQSDSQSFVKRIFTVVECQKARNVVIVEEVWLIIQRGKVMFLLAQYAIQFLDGMTLRIDIIQGKIGWVIQDGVATLVGEAQGKTIPRIIRASQPSPFSNSIVRPLRCNSFI